MKDRVNSNSVATGVFPHRWIFLIARLNLVARQAEWRIEESITA
jgi:hypothetical protein